MGQEGLLGLLISETSGWPGWRATRQCPGHLSPGHCLPHACLCLGRAQRVAAFSPAQGPAEEPPFRSNLCQTFQSGLPGVKSTPPPHNPHTNPHLRIHGLTASKQHSTLHLTISAPPHLGLDPTSFDTSSSSLSLYGFSFNLIGRMCTQLFDKCLAPLGSGICTFLTSEFLQVASSRTAPSYGPFSSTWHGVCTRRGGMLRPDSRWRRFVFFFFFFY